MAKFEDLVGDILLKLTVSDDKDRIEFLTLKGKKYSMFHSQDCCESVYINDITGDLQDLLDYPILLAEEVVQVAKSDDFADGHYFASGTWTFYKLATVKANVTIRWLGESSGYYSESVDFVEVGVDND